jgi:CHAD domain-containing protein
MLPESPARSERRVVVATRNRGAPCAGDVVGVALATSVSRLSLYSPQLRDGDDPEDLHQARVAVRRLRCDVRAFADLFDAPWSTDVVRDLKWLGSVLGPPRDADVVAARLRAAVGELRAQDSRAADALLAQLVSECGDRREQLRNTVADARFTECVERLQSACRRPAFAAAAEEPAATVMATAVRGQWRRVSRAVNALTDPPDDSQLHDVRIKTKRARYSTEAAELVWGRPARALAKALTRVQTALGSVQDAALAEEWLRAAMPRSPRAAFLAGELAGELRRERATARKAWRPAWHEASKKSLRSWLH